MIVAQEGRVYHVETHTATTAIRTVHILTELQHIFGEEIIPQSMIHEGFMSARYHDAGKSPISQISDEDVSALLCQENAASRGIGQTAIVRMGDAIRTTTYERRTDGTVRQPRFLSTVFGLSNKADVQRVLRGKHQRLTSIDPRTVNWVAFALAIADLDGPGIDGPETAEATSASFFLELNPRIHALVVAGLPLPIEDQEAMITWLDGQTSFYTDRQKELDREWTWIAQIKMTPEQRQEIERIRQEHHNIYDASIKRINEAHGVLSEALSRGEELAIRTWFASNIYPPSDKRIHC